TDRQRDRAARDAGRARRWPHSKSEKRHPEERAFGTREEQESDKETGDHAGARVAGRRAREENEEPRSEKRRDRERIERDPRGCERAAAETRERSGEQCGVRRRTYGSARGVGDRRNERGDQDDRRLSGPERSESRLEQSDAGSLHDGGEGHPEPRARDRQRVE